MDVIEIDDPGAPTDLYLVTGATDATDTITIAFTGESTFVAGDTYAFTWADGIDRRRYPGEGNRRERRKMAAASRKADRKGRGVVVFRGMVTARRAAPP